MKMLINLLFICLLVPLSSAADITEIMYDTPGSDTGREWIEIYSSEEINLSEYKLFEEEVNHRIACNCSGLFSGYAIIADKPDSFIADNPSYTGFLFDSAFSLRNSNESISLKKNDEIIEEAAYSSESGGNGNNNSLQFYAGKWCEGIPTPGKDNFCGVKENEADNISLSINLSISINAALNISINNSLEENESKDNDSELNISEDEINSFLTTRAIEEIKTEQNQEKKSESTPEYAQDVIYSSKNEKVKNLTLYLLAVLLALVLGYILKMHKI